MTSFSESSHLVFALFGLEGVPSGNGFPLCTLKTTQEKEMQDERTRRRKLRGFHGHFRIQRKTSTKKLTANGEESEKSGKERHTADA